MTDAFPESDHNPDHAADGGDTQPAAVRDLRAQVALFETAFEHALVGNVITRIEGPGRSSVVKCNPAFARMVGATVDDVLGRVGPSLIHPADAGKHRELVTTADALGSATGEIRLQHRAGRAIWAEVAVSSVCSDAGDLLRVVQAVDITARKEAEQHLRYLAEHDALTGVRGRRSLEQELARAASRVRLGERAALLLIDLNGFKSVNDTLGHSEGDNILVRVAAALRHTVRPDDTVARLGGDEFAVLLPDTSLDGAERVATKLAAAIARHGTTTSDGRTASVTGAIGIAVLGPESPVGPEEALRLADADMYRVKAASLAAAPG